jgi:O-antigen ligase
MYYNKYSKIALFNIKYYLVNNKFFYSFKNFFELLNYFFLILISLFLVIHHGISDALISIVCFNFLFFFYKNRKNFETDIFFNDKIIFYFLLFYLTTVLSSALSEFPLNSLPRSVFYIRFLIFYMACKYWLLNTEKKITYIIYTLSFLSIFVSLDVIYQFLNYSFIVVEGVSYKVGHDIFGIQSSYSGPRYQGPFGKSLIAGTFIKTFSILFLGVILDKLITKSSSLLNFFFLFLIIIFFTAITISGDRAPFFLFILSCLVLIIFSRSRIVILGFLCGLIFFIGFLNFNNMYKQRFTSETYKSLGFNNSFEPSSENQNVKNKFLFNLDTGYGHLFYSATKIWIDHPLLGAGEKNYRLICDRDKYNFKSDSNIQLCSTHPHNWVLELLSETGFLGLFFFILIFYYFTKNNNKLIFYNNFTNKNFTIKTLFISLFFLLWPFTTTGSIITNRSSIYLWLIFSLITSFLNIKADKLNK